MCVSYAYLVPGPPVEVLLFPDLICRSNSVLSRLQACRPSLTSALTPISSFLVAMRSVRAFVRKRVWPSSLWLGGNKEEAEQPY